jgi:hypothetical protein
VSAEKLAAHLRVERYGDFVLTDAVRPALHLPVVPREGYRRDTFRDGPEGMQIPVLVAAASREKLFGLFLEFLDPLGATVDVVLETSHRSKGPTHQDLFREAIDLPVLASHFCDFEDLLLNDGCAGVAVLSTVEPMEVQFDEHKLLVAYAQNLAPFEEILARYGVVRDDGLKLITEGEHLHSTDPNYLDAFEEMCRCVGVDAPGERVNWYPGEEYRE